MKTRSLHLGLLLALCALFLVAAACSEAKVDGIPPCTPIEGSDIDPCEPGAGVVAESIANAASVSLGDEPFTIRDYLDLRGGVIRVSHIIVRGTYVPNSARCIVDREFRSPPYIAFQDHTYESGVYSYQCFVDVRVNAYMVGSGPSTLTVMVDEFREEDRSATDAQVEAVRSSLENAFNSGGSVGQIYVPPGGIGGHEELLFLGPATDHSIEAWFINHTWNVERKDGSVIAVHPYRDYWLSRDQQLRSTTFQSKVELSLETFKTSATKASAARITENNGRLTSDPASPRVVTNAANLSQHYVDVGATPVQPPPPCGLAVPNHSTNPGLVQDCETLLGLKDELQGTGTLNWGVDTAIGSWDGVTTGGTPSRVTKLEVDDQDLTGSIPAGLQGA